VMGPVSLATYLFLVLQVSLTYQDACNMSVPEALPFSIENDKNNKVEELM
ncbi:hypothetical protein BgiMline_005874, partial [Biomphalaria glabrata]